MLGHIYSTWNAFNSFSWVAQEMFVLFLYSAVVFQLCPAVISDQHSHPLPLPLSAVTLADLSSLFERTPPATCCCFPVNILAWCSAWIFPGQHTLRFFFLQPFLPCIVVLSFYFHFILHKWFICFSAHFICFSLWDLICIIFWKFLEAHLLSRTKTSPRFLQARNLWGDAQQSCFLLFCCICVQVCCAVGLHSLAAHI